VKKFTHEVVTLWYRPPDVLLGNTHYSTAVDIWGIGCIFAEMVSGRPLFAGSNDADQVNRIFKILGTPTADSWPSMTSMPKYSAAMVQQQYSGKKLSAMLPRLGREGLDLLEHLLQPDPAKRVSAREAMRHIYFADLHMQMAAAAGAAMYH
jgi:serine/threonine protein kinase